MNLVTRTGVRVRMDYVVYTPCVIVMGKGLPLYPGRCFWDLVAVTPSDVKCTSGIIAAKLQCYISTGLWLKKVNLKPTHM